ncbi:MAG TPA: transglutaminase domain-containing protein, partial [Fimbriimonas sp.]
RREFTWEIRALAATNMVPMPAEVVEFRGRPARRIRDYSGRSSLNFENITVRGRSIEADTQSMPRDAVAQLPTSLLETTSLAGVPESVKALAREAAKGADNDYERAQQIKREIGRRAMYNLRAPAIPSDRDAVEHFLFTQKEGYCDLFASSMVAMARSIGIPARYATGFLPDAERRTGSSFIVVQADAHAWAELFFEGVGWVIFDATEDADQAPEGGRGQSTVGPPWYQSAWFRNAIDVVIVVAVLAAVILLLRSRKPVPGTNLNRKQLERLFVQFVSMLERKTRIRRQLSDTPSEYLAGVLPSLNGSAETATEINHRFEHFLFSADAPGEEDLAKLKEDLRNFKSMLTKEPAPRK